MDQTFVDSDQINKLVGASKITHKTIVVSQYDKAEGVPVLFKKLHFNELLSLKGKGGAKKILKL